MISSKYFLFCFSIKMYGIINCSLELPWQDGSNKELKHVFL